MYDGTRTMGAIVAARAAETPDREIVRFDAGPVTCGELDERSNRVGNALASLGLGRGDRVAVMLGNRAEYLDAWVGIAKQGLVEVPLNVGLRGDMLAYMLNQSGTSTIVVDAAWLDRIERIAAQVPGLRHVIAGRRHRRRRVRRSQTPTWRTRAACATRSSSRGPRHRPTSTSIRTTRP